MTSSLSIKRTAPAIQKRVDNHTQSFPPLDYSFHNAQKLEDAVAMEPRETLGGPKLIREGDRFHSHGINLNHNMLTGPMESLPNFVRMTLVDPNALTTLDLSFNVFTEIPKEVTQFPALKFFYFHKNMLSDPSEVHKLVPLTELKYLTLHGNPIELSVPYLRSLVLCLLPDLRSLNCSPVTKDIDFRTRSIMATPNKQTVRLQKDLQSLETNPLPFLRNLNLTFIEEKTENAAAAEGSKPSAPPSTGYNRLTGIMIGPDGSPYAGGHFRFSINFPPDYPFRAPEFIFTTAMLHPNVHSGAGTACHERLLATWAPSIGLPKFLTEMHKMLSEPNYDTPIQVDSKVVKNSEKARAWTLQFAQPTD